MHYLLKQLFKSVIFSTPAVVPSALLWLLHVHSPVDVRPWTVRKFCSINWERSEAAGEGGGGRPYQRPQESAAAAGTLCLSPGCYYDEYHRPRGLSNRNLFITVLEAGKSKLEVPTHSAPGENPLPRLQRAAFSLGPWCPWRGAERRSSLVSLLGRTLVQSSATSIPPHRLGPPRVNFREIQTFNSGHSPSSISPLTSFQKSELHRHWTWKGPPWPCGPTTRSINPTMRPHQQVAKPRFAYHRRPEAHHLL